MCTRGKDPREGKDGEYQFYTSKNVQKTWISFSNQSSSKYLLSAEGRQKSDLMTDSLQK